MVVVRGRSSRRWALLLQALAAARESLHQRARGRPGPLPTPGAFPRKRPRRRSSARMPWPCSPRAPCIRARSRRPGRAVPGGGPRRRPGAGRSGPAGPVGPEGYSRFRGNVPAVGVRRQRVVMRHDEVGRLVEIGARTRTIPPACGGRSTIGDQGCRFPGCNGHFTQGHHLRHWAHGGPTTLSNLTCSVAGIIGPCTRRVIRSRAYPTAPSSSGDRTATRCPRCRCLPWCPRIRSRLSSASRRAGPSCHRADGVSELARGGTECGWAIDVLHPLAQSSRPT